MKYSELKSIVKKYVQNIFNNNANLAYYEKVTHDNILTHIQKTPAKELPLQKKVMIENIEFIRESLYDLEQKVKYKTLANQLKVSVKEAKSLEKKANEVAGCFNMGYSMGSLFRVGVKKRQGTVWIGENDTREEYTNSSRYRARHGYYDLGLTLSELRNIQVIGGIPTIKLENKKISKCVVFKSQGKKHRFDIIKSDSFVTSDYHGETIEECEQWRKDQVLRLIKYRQDEKLRLLNEAKQEKENQLKLSRFVGFNHSRQAGNCKTGTEIFAQKHGLDINMGYRLDYLLSLEPNNYYIKRLFSVL